jgi:hypothetical protein
MMNYTRLMPIQIGAKVADFSKPMVLLSDCHRRIEMSGEFLTASRS